jgi:DNA-binding MarR family transcriptional regulator
MTRREPGSLELGRSVEVNEADDNGPPSGFYEFPLGNLLWHVRLTEIAMQKVLRLALLDTDVTKAQFGTMQILDQVENASSAALARTLTVSPQAMVAVVAGLESKGYIKRKTAPARSARVLVARLTAKGRVAFSAAAEKFRAVDHALDSTFSEAEQQTLVDLLAKMRTVFDELEHTAFAQPGSRPVHSGVGGSHQPP